MVKKVRPLCEMLSKMIEENRRDFHETKYVFFD